MPKAKKASGDGIGKGDITPAVESGQDKAAASKKAILNRIKTIKGHLCGIEKMIEEGKPCDEILIQVAAVKSSMQRVGAVILEEHAIDCLLSPTDDPEETKQRIERMLKTLVGFSK